MSWFWFFFLFSHLYYYYVTAANWYVKWANIYWHKHQYEIPTCPMFTEDKYIFSKVCVGGGGRGAWWGQMGISHILCLSLCLSQHPPTLDTAKESMFVMWQRTCQQGDGQGFDKPSKHGLRQYNSHGWSSIRWPLQSHTGVSQFGLEVRC